jgi:YYY domain-containing protein
MMDFLWAFLFWQWYELLGLPLRFALARAPLPPETRRVLSRLAGPVVLAFPLWLAAYFLPGMLAPVTAWLWWLLCLAGGWAWARHSGHAAPLRLLAWDVAAPGVPLPRCLRFHLGFEALCFLLFFGFIAWRRLVPEMTFDIGASAAEKFMNQMLFWTNWHAHALPAEDYWFAGHTLAYYDWAHWHWAWAARVAGFPVALALNLALARVTLLTVEGAFLLARGFGLRRAWSTAGAVATAWFGNPAGVIAAWQLVAANRRFGGPFDWSGYDVWGPSRAIKNVVDEFPAFSAILGDFHAHHLALPWLMALFALFAWGPRRVGGLPRWLLMFLPLAAAATLANAWNLPIIGLACGLWLIALLVRRPRVLVLALPFAVWLGVLLALLLRFQRGGAALPLDAPEPGAGWLARHGIMFLPAGLRSTPFELFNLWGLPLAVFAIVAALLVIRRPRRVSVPALFAGLALGAFVALHPTRLPGGTAWLWLAALLVLFAAAAYAPRWLRPRLAWATAGAIALLGLLEVVYLQDRFRGELARYNSYFKFSYAAWPILMLAGTAALAGLCRAARQARHPAVRASLGLAALILITLAALGGAIYPTFALPARRLQAARGDVPARVPTLNSVNFIDHRPPHAAEAALLDFIRHQVPPGERIAECGAKGPPPFSGAYDYGGRIASLTGHPVPLGWIHHEQQWRGPAFFAALDARAREVDQLYQADTPTALRAAATRLGVHWIVFGLPERARYGATSLEMLLSTARVEAAFLPSDAPPERENAVYLFDLRPGQSLKP